MNKGATPTGITCRMGITCRVGKGAFFAPCPPGPAVVGTLRFAHPTTLSQ
jgi:hypothetical protein